MRLADLVSNMTPSTFTIIATIIFVTVFVAVVVRALSPSARAEHQRALQLPLDDELKGSK